MFFDWRDRLKKISSDVGNLLLGRYVFRETQAVIAKNPGVEGVFARWMRINYAHSMALGIRRTVDTHRRALSLANFLRDIIANPKVIRRRTLLIQAVERDQRLAKSKRHRSTAWARHQMLGFDVESLDIFYNTLAGKPDSEGRDAYLDDRLHEYLDDHLDISLVGKDLSLIQDKANKVERFATKRLAHFDETAPLRIKYKEIDEALDAFDSAIAKYSRLFRLDWRPGIGFDSLSPDWKKVFEVRWKDQDRHKR